MNEWVKEVRITSQMIQDCTKTAQLIADYFEDLMIIWYQPEEYKGPQSDKRILCRKGRSIGTEV